MSDNSSKVGTIEWHDLSVEHAAQVKDFYADVVGWETAGVSMGDYDDFNMNLPGSGETVAGVCHARGSNAELPAQWMMYVRVADASASAAACKRLGGEIIDGPRTMGSQEFWFIRDPAGAALAIFSESESAQE